MDETHDAATHDAALGLSWADDGPNPYRNTASSHFCSIIEVAREFGLTLRALRFYESKGLIAPRRDGTARTYDRRQRDRLGLLVKAKSLGFTLAEIRQMLGTAENPSPGNALDMTRRQCATQIRLLEDRKREIEAALAELRRTYSAFYARVS